MSDRAHILVADDEQNLCRILVARLGRDGHLAEAVHDGVQALDRLRSGSYDLVFLDLRMPNLGGMEVLADIRQRGLPTAVVMMTAYDSPDTVRAALEAGADAYITKPFDLDWVAGCVAQVLQHRRAALGTPGYPSAPGSGAGSGPG